MAPAGANALYVLPEYEGRGIGSALWEGSLAALRERGVRVMQVWAATAASWAVPYYERRGCVPVATGDASCGEHIVPHTGYRIELS